MDHFREIVQKKQRFNGVISFHSGQVSSYILCPSSLGFLSLGYHPSSSSPFRSTSKNPNQPTTIPEVIQKIKSPKYSRGDGDWVRHWQGAASRVLIIYFCCLFVVFDNFYYNASCSYFMYLYFFICRYERLNTLVLRG
jgi:hypothetical protein